MRRAQDVGEAEPDRAVQLKAEAKERFTKFLVNVGGDLGWHWRFGPLDAATDATAIEIATAYTKRFGVSFEATRR